MHRAPLEMVPAKTDLVDYLGAFGTSDGKSIFQVKGNESSLLPGSGFFKVVINLRQSPLLILPFLLHQQDHHCLGGWRGHLILDYEDVKNRVPDTWLCGGKG